MADPEFSPAADDDDGIRKSFWEHLGDLRTAVMRSAMALVAALIICLCFAHRITQFLEYPIARMHMFEQDHPTVSLQFGDKKFGPFAVDRKDFPALPPGTSPHPVYRLSTIPLGDEQVLTIKQIPQGTEPNLLDVHLINLDPAEAFMVAFHIALYAAIVLSSPFWLYFMGSFIVPALKTKERTAIGQWLFWGVLLAIAGITLTYFLLLPVALRASIKYSELLGFSASDWQADQYITFVCKFILGMGIGFQFPLVVLLLVKMGLVTHQQLTHFRRHVIVVSLVLGALLTTPEVLTQVAMAVPLYLLYEICIWIAWYWDWKKRRNGETVEI
jgi:sec-independent protein translocase protein TatC